MDIGYQRRRDSVRLFAWHDVDNYGDRLGPALFHLLTERPVYIEARGLSLVFDQGAPRTVHCFLGTLGHLISGPHQFVLWGFGTAPASGPEHHGCRAISPALNIDFRALRGPLTRRAYVQAGYKVPDNIPYGDPALLVPGFFHPSPYQLNDFCVIPHHAHYEEWREKLRGMNVIDLRLASYEGLQALILEITKYRVIFSASLHATILGECFGIPTRPIAPTLPFKFDDFYCSVGKSGDYIPAIQRELNWEGLYEETQRDWRPAVWDPDPWLDASPFPISESLRQRLKEHYRKLRDSEPPRRAGGSVLPEEVRASYRLMGATNVPPPAASSREGEINDELLETTLLREQFRHPPDNWCLAIDDKVTRFTGEEWPARICDDGCELRARAGCCLLTDLVDVGEALEVSARMDLFLVEGLTEVWMQDQDFRTVAQLMIQPDGTARARKLSFWPTSPHSKVRLAFFPLRGRLVIREIEIVCLTEPLQ